MAHLRVRPFKAGLSPAEAGSIMEGQGERGPEGPHYPNRQSRTTGTGRAALPEPASESPAFDGRVAPAEAGSG